MQGLSSRFLSPAERVGIRASSRGITARNAHIVVLALIVATLSCVHAHDSALAHAQGAVATPCILHENDEVAIEQAEDGGIRLVTTARFANAAPLHTTSLHHVTADLLDEQGRVIGTASESALISLAPHGTSTFKLSCPLAPEMLDRAHSVRIRYTDASCGLHRCGTVVDEKAIERGRHRRERDLEMAQRERRISDWKTRFPEGDYSGTLLIGDSIMDMSRKQLEAGLPGVTVNADSGRSLEYGGTLRENQEPENGVLDYIRRDAGEYDRYVIGTGNNDGGGIDVDDAEEMIACLGPDKEIYFVTEMMTGNVAGMDATNATIDAMVGKYPNVHKVDWHGFVEGHESEYLADSCHPKKSAIPDYVNVMKQSLDVTHVHD